MRLLAGAGEERAGSQRKAGGNSPCHGQEPISKPGNTCQGNSLSSSATTIRACLRTALLRSRVRRLTASKAGL